MERRKRLRSKLISSRIRKRRREGSSNAVGEDESRMHLKQNGDEVLSTVGGDKPNPITEADTIRSVMIGKGGNAEPVCKKTLGSLTLEKIRQKHGTSFPDNSMKRPLKERLQLVKTPLKVAETKAPLKKRIELIKKAKEGEELALVKKEACGTKLSR